MTELLLGHGKYLALIVVLILTGAGLPVPEEVPIVAAGVLSAHRQMDPWLAFGACLVGAILGDSVMYWIGYHFGRGFVWRHPRWARFLHPEREEQIEQMLQHHGLKMFFLARFLVGVRAPMYMAAGVLKVPFRRFLLTDLFCATVVIGMLFGLSYAYGETISSWIRNAEVGLTVVVALIVLGVGFYLWRRHRRRQAVRSGGKAVAEGVPPTRTTRPEPERPAPDSDDQADRVA